MPFGKDQTVETREMFSLANWGMSYLRHDTNTPVDLEAPTLYTTLNPPLNEFTPREPDVFSFIYMMGKAGMTRLQATYNSVPLRKGVVGLDWYSGCNDRARFWEIPKEERPAVLEKGRHNIMHSKDWEESRPKEESCGMKLLLCSYYLKWKKTPQQVRGKRAQIVTDRQTNARYINNGDTTRVYSIVHTWKELVQAYWSLGRTGRHFEEMIMEWTPHKLYLDVEKDLDSPHSVTELEALGDLENVTLVFEGTFIPYLLEFVRDVLKIDACIDDLVITYSSAPGVKFSAHVVLSTKQGHYFKDRKDSHLASALMAKFMDEKAIQDEFFREWYYPDFDKVMVDYSVYGDKQRNMRMVGCCKITAKLRSDTHWTRARVFMPTHNTPDRPLSDYIISVYDAINHPERYKRITFSHAQVIEAAEFASKGIGVRIIKKSSELRKRAGIGIATTALTGNYILGGSGVLRTRDGSGETDNVFMGLTSKMSADAISMCQRVGESIKDTPESWTEYYNVGLRIMQNVCEQVHPGNSISAERSDPSTAPMWLYRVEMDAFVPGMYRKNAAFRYCYFGCVSGQHRVRFYILCDFSVGYHCFGHNCTTRRGIIISSPVYQENKVRPGLAPVADYTPEIEAGLLDYNEVAPGANDDNQHMRELLLPEEMGGTDKDKVTYLLHGGMGTGKTTTVASLIQKCRRMRENPRILSISFRVMLAKNASETLKLDYYKTSESRGLSDTECLALQLDSVERLLEMCDDKADRSRLKGGHDILFLDELCSLLAHLDSDTLKRKLQHVWHVFFRLVRSAKVLVCCDADMGPREQRFIRMSRGYQRDNGSWYIPGLSYHRNHYIGIKTKFIEYRGEAEWAEKIIFFSIAERKNVFIASNSIAQILRLREWVEIRVRDILKALDSQIRQQGGDPESDERIEHLEDLLNSIDTITSLSTETEKNEMSDSNRTWINSKILFISPTVGAGVDFNRRHFDVAMVYATNKSCCARALNQMRGRARDIATGECHVYINSIVTQQEQTESVLPVTASMAMETLRLRREAYMVQPMDDGDGEDEDGFFYFSRSLIPDRLMEIQAHNLAETNRSYTNLRMEWVKLQQACDPGVEYIFDDKLNREKNIQFLRDMAHLKVHVKRDRANQVANQRDCDLNEYNSARMLDKMGQMGDIETSQPKASVFLEKNEIRHFYGMKESIPPEKFARAMEKMDTSLEGREKVNNIIRVLFLEQKELEQLAKHENLTTSMVIQLSENNRITHTINSGSRMAQESEVTDYEKRVWAKTLMRACGGDINKIKTNIFEAFEFHSGVASRILENDSELQDWLTSQIHRVEKVTNISPAEAKRLIPVHGQKFAWSHVYGLAKSFFSKEFDIHFTQPYYNKKKGEDRSLGKCADPDHRIVEEVEGKKKRHQCKKAIALPEDINLVIEKIHARVSSRTFSIKGGLREKIVERLNGVVKQKLFDSEFIELLDPQEVLEKQREEVKNRKRQREDVQPQNEDEQEDEGGGYGYGYGLDILDGSEFEITGSDKTPKEDIELSPLESDTSSEGTNESTKKRKLNDIKTVSDRRMATTRATVDIHTKQQVKQRDEMWGVMKQQFIQTNPATLDPISFRNLMLTPTYKVLTKRSVMETGRDHKSRLENYIGHRVGPPRNPHERRCGGAKDQTQAIHF